jgi:hypothetical protein
VTAHKRPEPLVTRAKVTATISGLVSLLVTLGVVPATLGDAISGTAEAVVAGVALVLATVPTLVHAWQARGVVTPTADPRNDAGARLVPAGSAAASLDVEVAFARADAIATGQDADTL